MKKFSYLEHETAYSAAISDTNIERTKNLRRLWLSFQGDMTAGTAKTVENLLAAIDPFELKVGATPRFRLTGSELLAYNRLWLDKLITTQKPGATTDDKVRCLGMEIPMNYAVGGPTISYNVAYTAATGIDTMLLSLTADLQDAALTERPQHVMKTSYTPPGTGALKKAWEEVLQGDLAGLLFYSTTVPVDDADTTSCAEIEVSIDGDRELQAYWWDLYRQKNWLNDVDGTATVQLYDNWGLLDLREDPIPAGKSVRIDVLSDDTNAVKIIPIQLL